MVSVKPLKEMVRNTELVYEIDGDEQYNRPFHQNAVCNDRALGNQCVCSRKGERMHLHKYTWWYQTIQTAKNYFLFLPIKRKSQ